MDACCYNYLPCPPALPSVPASQWVAIPFTCPVTQALKEPLLPHASQYCWFFLGSSSFICCLSFFPVRAKLLQSYPTLLCPYGLYSARLLCPRGPLSTGILQVRILEWVAISFSRGSSQPRDRTWASCLGRWILYHWATSEAWGSVCSTTEVSQTPLCILPSNPQMSRLFSLSGGTQHPSLSHAAL